MFFPAAKGVEDGVVQVSLRPAGAALEVTVHDDGPPFDPRQGYGNWFWGLTPSCLRSMLDLAGFRVEEEREEAFARTLICAAASPPFCHRLPGQADARELGAAVSASAVARPA